jgi:SAM-dependent methyltransferase
VEGYDATTYGERFADVYDAWYSDITDAAACCAALAELAAARGGGPVLELGVGSGRLAIPLAERGVEVHGIDASPAMLDRLRAKSGGDAVHVTLGDMADLALVDPPPFAVVFVAFNTFFNLGTEDDQRRCLQRVAELLQPDGVFVVEAFVPADAGGDGIDGSVAPRQLRVDEVVLTVSQRDREAQTISGQHVHITEAGIRLRPWHLRYLSPTQLDDLAASCGLVVEQRDGGWKGEPFTDGSTAHITRYRSTSFGDR